MKRLAPTSLVLSLVLLTGCGGRSPRRDGTSDPTPAATLGSASLDLAVTNLTNPVAAAAMVGTGEATGSLSIVDVGQVQAGTVDVRATLVRTNYSADGNLIQVLSLRLVHAEALAVGDSFTLDGTTNMANYAETKLVTSGMFAGESSTTSWGSATGGTATIMARSGATITLSLKDVALTMGDPYPNPITVSGTVAGTLSYPPI